MTCRIESRGRDALLVWECKQRLWSRLFVFVAESGRV